VVGNPFSDEYWHIGEMAMRFFSLISLEVEFAEQRCHARLSINGVAMDVLLRAEFAMRSLQAASTGLRPQANSMIT
jgi:hypothetical protein